MLTKHSRSDTTSYAAVPPSHRVDGRANKAGLTKRQIPNAVIARFHTKYEPTRGCWLWQAGKFAKGYGMVSLGRNFQGKQHTEYAHRVAYVLVHGPIPAGSVVMHTCDVPACVNPFHLVLGTQGDNVRDASAKGRLPKSRPAIQKITDAQVRDIRESIESSVTLAKRYGVTLQCISVIRRGLRRKAA